MNHPKIGERVRVVPASGQRIQRGEFMYGQFLPESGQDVLWDEYLHARLCEGALTWTAIEKVNNGDHSAES